MNPPPRFRLPAAVLLLALAGGVGATIVSGTPATDAQATFSTAGSDILFFYMPDYLGDAPQTVCTVYPTVSRVPLHRFYILDENGNRPTNLPDNDAALAAINKIWRQAGMEFYWAGATNLAGRTEFLTIDDETIGLEDLCTTYPVSNGVRVFFTEDISSEIECVAAFTLLPNGGVSHGIFIPSRCPVETFAHELGHACGLDDLYVAVPPSETPRLSVFDLLLSENDCPIDETGSTFYADDVPKGSCVTSCLMYGFDSYDFSIDIPRGQIFAANRTGATGLQRAGLSNLVRNPQSEQGD